MALSKNNLSFSIFLLLQSFSLYAQDSLILNKYLEIVSWKDSIFINTVIDFDSIYSEKTHGDFFNEFLPKEITYSNRYKKDLYNAKIPTGLINYTTLIFQETKKTLKEFPKAFEAIKDVQLEVIQNDVTPYDLRYIGNKILISEALVRALYYLSINDFEFGLESEFESDRNVFWMYASQFYVRFYSTLSFMFHHEFAHIYLKKKSNKFRKQVKIELLCDCLASQFYEKSEEKDLYIQWQAKGDLLAFRTLMESILKLGEKEIWGLEDESLVLWRIEKLNNYSKKEMKKCKRIIKKLK